MNGKIFFIYLSIGCLTLACKDPFSQVIDLEIPEPEPGVAIFGRFSNRDTQYHLSIGKAISINEEVLQLSLPGQVFAEWLNPDGSVLNFEKTPWPNEPLPPQSFQPVVSLSSQELLPGKTYRVRVKYPGFPEVSALQIMPEPVALDQIAYFPEGGLAGFGEKADAFEIFINDPPGTLNYYSLEAFREGMVIRGDINGSFDTTFFLSPINIRSSNPLVFDSEKLTFSDEQLLKTTIPSLRINIDPIQNDGRTHRILFRLHHLTEDGFKFNASYSAYQNAVDNPFAEPVTVYNNVSGGYGIFSLSNVSETWFER